MEPPCEHGKVSSTCPDCRLAKQRQRGARQMDERKRLDAIAAAPKPKLEPVLPVKVDVDVVELRDKSILSAIDRVQFVRLKDLRLPTGDPAAADAIQAEAAIRMALTRLKAKGLIARTGDTWSRVGVGMAAN